MKIFLSISRLTEQGGITPSVLNLLSEIRKNHDVTLCVLSHISKTRTVPSGVKVIMGSNWFEDCLAPKQTNLSPLRRVVWLYRKVIYKILGLDFLISKAVKDMCLPEEYDVAIAYHHNIYRKGKHVFGADYDVVQQCVKAKRKIAWIHTDPVRCGFHHELCKKILKDFDATVCVSKDNQQTLNEMYPEGAGKSYVVYNMYDIQQILSKAIGSDSPYKDNHKLHIVTVARLYNVQKRINRIINTCQRLKEEGYINFDWTIVGDGPDKIQLQQTVKKFNLTNVYLVGSKSNPYPYMMHADVFVLTSQYEGFGMSIKEAQIVGTPTIITNFGCASEVITNKLEGFICDNSTDGVYSAIKSILVAPSQLIAWRKYLKENPVTNSLALQQFEEVIKNRIVSQVDCKKSTRNRKAR